MSSDHKNDEWVQSDHVTMVLIQIETVQQYQVLESTTHDALVRVVPF